MDFSSVGASQVPSLPLAVMHLHFTSLLLCSSSHRPTLTSDCFQMALGFGVVYFKLHFSFFSLFKLGKLMCTNYKMNFVIILDILLIPLLLYYNRQANSLVRITYLSRIFIPFMQLSFILIWIEYIHFRFFYFLRPDTLYSGQGAVRQIGKLFKQPVDFALAP